MSLEQETLNIMVVKINGFTVCTGIQEETYLGCMVSVWISYTNIDPSDRGGWPLS